MRKVTNQIFHPDQIHSIAELGADAIEVSDRLIKIDQKKVDELAESIHINGQLNPITCVKRGQKYKVLAGAHRLAAMQQLWKKYPEEQYRIGMNIITVAEADEQIIEIVENLHRRELTEAEHADFTARVLEMMGKSTKNSKSTTTKKVPLVLFKTPTQAEIIKTLNTSKMTFQRQFKAYQTDSGATSNWTKLTEAEYDGFIQWFKDKAKAANDAADTKADDAAAKKDVASRKIWAKQLGVLTTNIKTAHASLGGSVLDEVQGVIDELRN